MTEWNWIFSKEWQSDWLTKSCARTRCEERKRILRDGNVDFAWKPLHSLVSFLYPTWAFDGKLGRRTEKREREKKNSFPLCKEKENNRRGKIDTKRCWGWIKRFVTIKKTRTTNFLFAFFRFSCSASRKSSPDRQQTSLLQLCAWTHSRTILSANWKTMAGRCKALSNNALVRSPLQQCWSERKSSSFSQLVHYWH